MPALIKTELVDRVALKPVYFGYDPNALTEEARQILRNNASWLIANNGINITIEDHCDERGSDEYNFALGESRALAVKTYLAALGVPAERLSTLSFGEERPAVPGHTEVVWAKNRRAEFN